MSGFGGYGSNEIKIFLAGGIIGFFIGLSIGGLKAGLLGVFIGSIGLFVILLLIIFIFWVIMNLVKIFNKNRRKYV